MPTLSLARTISGALALSAASCAPAPAPSPAAGSEAKIIRATEHARLAALVAGDAATAAAFHADDFPLLNPVGAVLSKAEYLGAVSSGQVDRFQSGKKDARRSFATARTFR